MKTFLFVCVVVLLTLINSLNQTELVTGKISDIGEIKGQKVELSSIDKEDEKKVQIRKEAKPERQLLSIKNKKQSKLRKLVTKFTEQELGLKKSKKVKAVKVHGKKRKLFIRTVLSWFGFGKKKDHAAEERRRKEEARKREEERKRRILEAKRKKTFNDLFNSVTTAYPLLYRYKNEYCNGRCSSCWYKDKYICTHCKAKCHEFLEKNAKPKQNQITHYELRFYKYFHKYKMKCGRFNQEIYGICKAENYHHGRYNWSTIHQCNNEGRKGAYVMCAVTNYAPTHKMIKTYWHARSYLGGHYCKSCQYVSKDYCYRQNGSNKQGYKDCLKPALSACFSYCRRPSRLYFRHYYEKLTRQIMYKQHISCGECPNFCYYEAFGNCVTNSSLCFNRFRSNCIHQCKYTKCPAYKRKYHYDLKVLEQKRQYFLAKTSDEFRRAKNKQQRRNEYDDKRLNKLENLVSRYNRDSVYDSVLIMEGSLYEEQRKMVAQLAGDIKAEDDLFMSRVLAAYISEEELNKADDEIKIFSEYSF